MYLTVLVLVSLGGTAGLFIGASILSFVEIIFYFIIRPLDDYLIQRKLLKLTQNST